MPCIQEKYVTFEEKETDVNIAVHMVSLALQNKLDKILLFSADSDLIPAIREIKCVSPAVTIKVVLPYDRESIMLVNNSHENARIKRRHLEKHQFPDKIILAPSKNLFLEKPCSWR